MNVVALPFKDEDPGLVAANMGHAASVPGIDEVWAISPGAGEAHDAVAGLAGEVESRHGKPAVVLPQRRIGSHRPGKGDAMNTAIVQAAGRGCRRLHFYDADISNFGPAWVEAGERRAEEGIDVVRHRYPRAATDAMITWMITRPALAMMFPGGPLSHISQPLGGELVLDRRVIEGLASEPEVAARSDWGIDTVLTYFSTELAATVHESHVADGKRHALYGSLRDLRLMALECLDAAQSLRGLSAPTASLTGDDPKPVPADLQAEVGFDVGASMAILTEGWTDAETELCRGLPGDLGTELLRCRDGRPRHEAFDMEAWGPALGHLLAEYRHGSGSWRSLAFRMWVARVLNYATGPAELGYEPAIAYLESTIDRYRSEGRSSS